MVHESGVQRAAKAKILMTAEEQIEHFENDLDALVDRYRSEYEITFASTIWILQMKIWLLCKEAQERQDEV